MGSINLFRINKVKEFCQKIEEYKKIGTKKLKINNSEATVSLYINHSNNSKKPSWNWAVEEMGEGEDLENVANQPSGILKIELMGNVYAVSFGHAFFTVEKYCDKDFGIEFAKRIELDEIKTTTLLSPNSNRNKTVSTFIDYKDLEFDSGESVIKLKAKCDNEEELLFKPTLEMGSSIKFTIIEDSIFNILKLIIYVEEILKRNIIHKIPMFLKVRDKEKIETLENILREKICKEEFKINLSEMDIIGATEVFFSNESEYNLSYKGKKKHERTLSIKCVLDFLKENKFEKSEILDVKVTEIKDSGEINLGKVHDLIDYTDEDQKCLLNKGNWMMYNDDFMEYLHASLSEIECKYCSDYDFRDEVYNNFIDEQLKKDSSKSKNDLKNKYYREYVFNKLREEDGYIVYDRESVTINGSKIEVMDLYRDKTMFAVKIGNSSEKLSYVVDQSQAAMKFYKKGSLDTIRHNGKESQIPEIQNVALWIILDNNKHIEDENGVVDLSKLKYLILKNKIDQWKKEVRLSGMKPIIYINYTK